MQYFLDNYPERILGAKMTFKVTKGIGNGTVRKRT